jgi:hypothetical protein
MQKLRILNYPVQSIDGHTKTNAGLKAAKLLEPALHQPCLFTAKLLKKIDRNAQYKIQEI